MKEEAKCFFVLFLLFKKGGNSEGNYQFIAFIMLIIFLEEFNKNFFVLLRTGWRVVDQKIQLEIFFLFLNIFLVICRYLIDIFAGEIDIGGLIKSLDDLVDNLFKEIGFIHENFFDLELNIVIEYFWEGSSIIFDVIVKCIICC